MSSSVPCSSNFTRGYTVALVSAVILSTTAIFIRHLTQTYHMPPLILAFWRDVFVVLTLLPVLGLLRPLLLRVTRQHLFYLVVYGFMLAIFNTLWTLSVALTGAAISTVLVYSSAGFTALLGWCLFKERLNWAKLLAIALSLGGCVLVSGALDSAVWQGSLSGTLLGIFTGVLSGLWYAIYSLMGRSASQRGLNPWTTVTYTFGFAAIFLLFFNVLSGGLLSGLSDLFWLGDALPGWGALFLLAAGPTVVGFGLYNVSLGLLPSSVANLILTLEPAFTAVIAYFLLGERLNGMQLGGSLMILMGVVLLRVYEGRLESRRRAKGQGRFSFLHSN
jgi:drug/metabolite transporter (DMT)-like permease